MKKETTQQFLTGKTRLPGFSAPWIEKTLGEIGILSGSGVDKKDKELETPVRLLNYLDVFHSDFIHDRDLSFWTTATDHKIEACNIKKGDVFFTPSSEMPYDIALSAVAMEDIPLSCYSYHLYRLRFIDEFDLLYRGYMFKSEDFYKQANLLCEGSGKRYVLTMPNFRSIVIKYPSDLSEQRAIAEVLSDMDAEIEVLETKREKLIQIKQGMMQELLTGKTRLL